MSVTELIDMSRIEHDYGISVNTLRSWRYRNRGEGPQSFTVGRRVKYRREEVERWLRDLESAARATVRTVS